jgi:murein DD-endopeptidase MepM/ murein hydrolase activator NlpD
MTEFPLLNAAGSSRLALSVDPANLVGRSDQRTVRARLLLILLVFLLSLAACGSAFAYPWPIKPFDRQHPIRANFGDPRTRFWNTMLTNGLEGPGLFQFHNGLDIAAPQDTPVYPIASGTVRLIDGAAVAVRSPGRTFQYFHIVPAVLDGQHVVARRTVLGYVIRAYEHVHLTEIRGGRVRNPLAPGGIAPYRDATVPEVDSITMRGTWSLLPLDSAHVCGTVSLVATAFDVPPMPVPGPFAGFPVSPSYVTWSLERVRGESYVRDAPAADFRVTLPSARNFWKVYARGSFQNAPRFSNRQYLMAGRYVYNLADVVDTRWYPDGPYQVTVRARDMRGNESEAAQDFTIANEAADAAGCTAGQPSSSP